MRLFKGWPAENHSWFRRSGNGGDLRLWRVCVRPGKLGRNGRGGEEGGQVVFHNNLQPDGIAPVLKRFRKKYLEIQTEQIRVKQDGARITIVSHVDIVVMPDHRGSSSRTVSATSAMLDDA